MPRQLDISLPPSYPYVMPTLTNRTIISLESDDKQWLDEESRRSGLPKSAIIRMSIRYMRMDKERSFENLLNQTSGTWRAGDGLAYQERLRSEWE